MIFRSRLRIRPGDKERGDAESGWSIPKFFQLIRKTRKFSASESSFSDNTVMTKIEHIPFDTPKQPPPPPGTFAGAKSRECERERTALVGRTWGFSGVVEGWKAALL